MKCEELEERCSITEMRLKDEKNEKDLYFQKLSSLDEFLSKAMSMPESQENPIVMEYLNQIQSILLKDEIKVK